MAAVLAACEPPTAGGLTTVIPLEHGLSGPSVILDASHRPLVAYLDHVGRETRDVLFVRGGDDPDRFEAPVTVHAFPQQFGEVGGEGFRPIALARDAASGTLGLAMAADGQQIVVALSHDEGASWQHSVVHAPREGFSVRGPVLALHGGRIHLAFYRDEVACDDTGACVLRPEVAYFSGDSLEGLQLQRPPRLPESYTYYRAPLSLALDASGQVALTYFLGGFDGGAWPSHLQLAYWRPESPEAARITRTDAVMRQRPSASLAFQGTAPRVAFHFLYEDGVDVASSHVASSADGLAWDPPVPLPRDAGDHTGLYQSLAFDSAGRAAVAATFVGTAGTAGAFAGPKLFRTEDLQSWAIHGEEATLELGAEGFNPTVLFDAEDRLTVAFAWVAEEDEKARLPTGIVFWRVP